MNVLLNGKVLLREEAKIPVSHSGVTYGTGCFETIRAEAGKLLFFDDHYKRLKAGLLYLGAAEAVIPDQQELVNQSKQLLRKNSLINTVSKIRIQCTLAELNGYALDGEAELFTLITARKYSKKKRPLILTIAETRVVPGNCVPATLKLCNMLHYRNAFREALRKNADDSVMLTVNGYVSETSIANLFWIKGNTIYTPSETCDLLPGITRNYVIQAIHDCPELHFQKGNFDLDTLMSSDSVWMTNSLMEIQQVQCIDGQSFEVDTKRTDTLLHAYQNLKFKT